MKQVDKIRFFRAKADLIIALANDVKGREWLTAMFAWINEREINIKLPPYYFRRSEEILDGVVDSLPTEHRQQIHNELIKQFCFVRLGTSPKNIKTVIKNVLKNGKINTDDDARLIGEILDHTDNINTLGKETYRSLAKIHDEYDCRHD